MLLLVSGGRVLGGEEDVLGLLRLIPADLPAVAVVVDIQKLDKSVSSFVKRLNPDEAEPSILADIKSELPFAEWVNFSKPMGIAKPMGTTSSTPGSAPDEGLLWVNVPDFATKAKSVEGAAVEEGLWKLPFDSGTTTLYVKLRGDYVIVSRTKEALVKLSAESKSLAEEVKARLDVLRGRDVLIHLNVDPVRSMALASIAQSAQMIPMIAMMVGQGGTADPAMITAVATAAFDAAKRLVEQVAYVDVFIGLNDQVGSATILTGYKEGPIRDYLARQKPASAPLLADLEEQSYAFAAGCQLPGADSPFVDYLIDKMTSAIPQPQPAPEGGAAPQSDALRQALKIMRELYRQIEGGNLIVAGSPEGMRFSGNYMAKDAKALLDLLKQSITSANPLMQQLSSGAKYEPLGEKKLGDVSVEEFTMKVDESNPAAAGIRAMYGANPKFTVGVVGGRVRFCMGSEAQVSRAFAGKIDKPLTSNKYVSEALAAIPEKRNMVLLIDPPGIIGLVPAELSGIPKTEPAPPGPPIAVSVSLAGEPARVDIHVPLRAIERFKQTVAPNEGT
jgi:hypothetical protein